MPLYFEQTGFPGGTTTGGSAISTSANTDIGPTFSVPGGLAAVGAAYRLKSVMNLTAVGTAGSVATVLAIYYGGLSGSSLVNLTLTNAATSVTGVIGYVEVTGEVIFTSASAATSYLSASVVSPSGNGVAPYSRGGTFNQTGLVTSSSSVLTLAWQFQAVTGGPSVIGVYSDISRIA
jgi:hypothetical protein